jgi:phage regulator Rha-like protein
MSDAFEALKAKLAQTGSLTDEEIAAADLTEEQKLWLNAERYAKQRDTSETVTLEQYLEANKVLDSAPEGSPEYEAALKIVERYEQQA